MRRIAMLAVMLFAAACAHHEKVEASKAEPAKAEPSGLAPVKVEFASAAATKAGAAVEDTNYSEQPGDAQITKKEFADGVVTYSGQVGMGKGSSYAGIGLWAPIANGKTLDASKYKSVTFKLTSTAGTLRLRLAGGDTAARGSGCYPVVMQDVTDKLAEYTVPISKFKSEAWCGPKAITVEQTLPTLYGFEIADISVAKKPVTISVGSITLNP